MEVQIPHLEDQILCLEKQDSHFVLISVTGKSNSIFRDLSSMIEEPCPIPGGPGFMVRGLISTPRILITYL